MSQNKVSPSHSSCSHFTAANFTTRHNTTHNTIHFFSASLKVLPVLEVIPVYFFDSFIIKIVDTYTSWMPNFSLHSGSFGSLCGLHVSLLLSCGHSTEGKPSTRIVSSSCCYIHRLHCAFSCTMQCPWKWQSRNKQIPYIPWCIILRYISGLILGVIIYIINVNQS